MPTSSQKLPSKRISSSLIRKMLGASVVSGVLSGITLTAVPGAMFVGPGILFGLATAWFFISSKWLDYVQAFIWIVASTGAWYAAMRVYSSPTFLNAPNGDRFDGMLLAGLVGSMILAVVLSLLVRRVGLKNILVTAIISVSMALLMYEILASGSGTQLGGGDAGSYVKLATAFALWQVGVGFSLMAYWPKTQKR